METQNKNKFAVISRVCLLLSFVSMFTTIALSISLHSIEHDNKHLATFVSKSSSLQPDFEQSLAMYTENTQSAMKFIETLRPDNESEYIDFIGQVEDMGRQIGLDVDLESLGSAKGSLNFSASFYGSKNNVLEFISGLENLPYYVRVLNVTYRDLFLVSAESQGGPPAPNAQITFMLYVK